MILNNYYKALAMLLTGTDKGVVTTSNSASSSYLGVSYAGELLKISNAVTTVKNGYGPSDGIVFGSGTTPPTLDDYKLESLLTTITGTAAATKKNTTEYCEVTVLATITNTASADKTVSEVGVYINTSGNWGALVERTVLDAPVTIPAGGVGQIAYTIRMNYPTA